jgi:hypothetical protein
MQGTTIQNSEGNVTICCNISRTLSTSLGVRVVDGRPDLTSFSVVSRPDENAYAIQTPVHMIKLHHRTLAVSGCKFHWHFSQAAQKIYFNLCSSIWAAKLPAETLHVQ